MSYTFPGRHSRAALRLFLGVLVAATACSPDRTTSFEEDASFSNGSARGLVCHWDADVGEYMPVTVAEQSVPAHLGHGDALPGDRLPRRAGVFGPGCEYVFIPLPNVVEIHIPSAVAGFYLASYATFGPEPTLTGTTGALVLVDDGIDDANDACSPLVGFAPGSIALADRGTCTFAIKVANAEAAGAIALVVVNNVPGTPPAMGPDDAVSGIPLVMVSLADGALMKIGLPAMATVRRLP